MALSCTSAQNSSPTVVAEFEKHPSSPRDLLTFYGEQIQKITKVYQGTQQEYDFMREAVKTALSSSDPNTQVGAIVVNSNNEIIGRGYNSFLPGCEKKFNWIPPKEEGTYVNQKYPYVIHAEVNAIADAESKGHSLNGCRMYVNLNPCNTCVLSSQVKRIKEIVCFQKLLDPPYIKAAFVIIAATQGTKSSIQYKAITIREFPDLPVRFKALK